MINIAENLRHKEIRCIFVHSTARYNYPPLKIQKNNRASGAKFSESMPEPFATVAARTASMPKPLLPVS
jgi:hypothetical protein